jgi:hypothetical protein
MVPWVWVGGFITHILLILRLNDNGQLEVKKKQDYGCYTKKAKRWAKRSEAVSTTIQWGWRAHELCRIRIVQVHSNSESCDLVDLVQSGWIWTCSSLPTSFTARLCSHACRVTSTLHRPQCMRSRQGNVSYNVPSTAANRSFIRFSRHPFFSQSVPRDSWRTPLCGLVRTVVLKHCRFHP